MCWGDKLGVPPLARKYQSIMQDFAGSAQLNPRDSPRRPIAKGLGRLAGQISKPTGSLVPRVSRPTALRVRGIRILHLTRGLKPKGDVHPRVWARRSESCVVLSWGLFIQSRQAGVSTSPFRLRTGTSSLLSSLSSKGKGEG